MIHLETSKNAKFFLMFFWLVFSRGKIRVLFFYNVALISDVQESDSVIHTYIYTCVCVCVCVFFFRFFSIKGELGSIPGSGKSAEEGNGNPLQYSCLENPMDRGAWQVKILGVAKNWTQQQQAIQ